MALTAKDIQDKADAIVGPLIVSIQAVQDVWITTHKGYWQGILTPTAIPVDGVDTVPDNTVKPVNDSEATAWKDLGITVPVTLPCSLAVDTHDGPSGKGYSIRSYVIFGTETFVKVTPFGKEAPVASGWAPLGGAR